MQKIPHVGVLSGLFVVPRHAELFSIVLLSRVGKKDRGSGDIHWVLYVHFGRSIPYDEILAKAVKGGRKATVSTHGWAARVSDGGIDRQRLVLSRIMPVMKLAWLCHRTRIELYI